ncbi:MAG TPA: glycosyltransferase family 39 protein [Vicinamibacterales bacterium]|nr:glycosyltransferase family 39 protein [Vicinamibacterales bacterium]
MRHWTPWAFALVFIVALLVRLPGFDRLLDGSEVDYVLAARRGFLTNYLDLGTRPVSEYVAAGLAMAGFTGEAGAGADTDLWTRDVAADDIAAYRHYHPPLFIYTIQAVERLAGHSGTVVRLVPLAFSLATIAMLYFGCALLVPVRGAQTGVLAAAILSVMSLHIATSAEIGWHVPYASLSTLSLFAIGYFRTRPSLQALVAAVVMATIAFMMLEHAVFLYVTLAVVLVVTANPWLRVSRSGVSMHRGLLVAAGAALLTMLVVWPASLIKLSIVKNLGVHAYYSRTLELSPRFYDVYLVLADRYPVMVALAAVTAVLSIVRRRHLPPALLPFAIFALATCVLQFGNTNLKPLYFVSLLPPLALLTAAWIVDAMSASDVRARVAGRTFAAAAVFALVFTVSQTLRARERVNTRLELLDRLSSVEDLAGARVLAWPPGSHAAQMLGFYLPEATFMRVIDEPRSVRQAREALRRGAFRFVVVDLGAVEPREGAPGAAPGARYRRLFEILGESDADGYQVWRLRD